MAISKRRSGPKPKQEFADAKEREQNPIREINKVLDQEQVREQCILASPTDPCDSGLQIPAKMQVDLAQLRKLASERGLVNSEVQQCKHSVYNAVS